MAKAKVDKAVYGQFSEIGRTGLKRTQGYVYEEFLPKLQGNKALQIWEEMRTNDSTVAGVLFAIEMLIRQVEWRVEPGGETDEDLRAAELIESCKDDMSQTWAETITDILTMLPFGFCWMEQCYKKREGPKGTHRSKFSDGLIGWRKWSIRAQITRWKWEFDTQGGIEGMWQSAAPDYTPKFIPIDKSLLFRPRLAKNNPEGHALSPDTPIPTPDGWRTMDDLREGDKVFDEQGRVRYVTARQDWERRPCYRVTFNGGSSIIADANHLWLTQTLRERTKREAGQVRSTEEIAGTVKALTHTEAPSNHGIAWAKPLDYPTQHLPVDPYYLGLWLGDGISRTADVASHKYDAEESAERIREAGYYAEVIHNGPVGCLGALIRVRDHTKWSELAPSRQLAVLGVAENKHIPEAYLRGSRAQRLALLQGLMDSDGYTSPWGQCEFSNTNRTLIDGCAELVRSLGCAAFVILRKQEIPGERKAQWNVKFTPDFEVFRLTRKAVKCKTARARKYHYITRVEPVEPRRTVCIEVDSPSHLFLAGLAMVPTHNSVLRPAYRSWYFLKRIQEIEAIGIERDLAGFPVMEVPAEITMSSAPPEMQAIYNTVKQIVQNVRRDQQEGLVMPQAYDPETKQPLYKFSLLSAGGERQFDVNAVILRYQTDIARSMLAEFLMLGSTETGSFALSSDKTRLFSVAIATWLQQVCGPVNQYAIPRLLEVNGFSDQVLEHPPTLVHGDLEKPDLGILGDFLAKLAGAGMPLFPDPELENPLRKLADLPEMPKDVVEQRKVEDEEAKELKVAAEVKALEAPNAAQGSATAPGKGQEKP